MTYTEVPDRIFSIPGRLGYVLIKDDRVYLVIGDRTELLTCRNVVPMSDGVCYTTYRGVFEIFDKEIEQASRWDGMELMEPLATEFVLDGPGGRAGFTVYRTQLSAH